VGVVRVRWRERWQFNDRLVGFSVIPADAGIQCFFVRATARLSMY